MTRNEAAERLRVAIFNLDLDVLGGFGLAFFDAALAAERHATVERIRGRILAGAMIPPEMGNLYLQGIVEARTHLLRILDEEAAR